MTKFDLSNLSTSALSNEGVEVEILTLENDPTGVVFTVAGTDSNLYKSEQKKIQQKLFKTMQKKKDIDLSASDQDAINIMAKCTVAWKNVTYNGKELDCTYANAVKVYTDIDIIREQVSGFMNDRANFIKG